MGAALLVSAGIRAPAHPKLRTAKGGLGEILARINDSAKHLKTVTADLDYTTVTVLVDDRSTESGRFFLHNPKNPSILIKFDKPDPKSILFKKNRAEIYYPKANRVDEYDLERQSGLVQQFLLLGFGTDASALRAAYDVKLVGEEELEGDTTAVLDLAPKRPEVRSQLSKIRLWVSEDSWLPAQQQFFQPGGDYLIARYKNIRVNRDLPGSAFELETAPGAQRVKKN